MFLTLLILLFSVCLCATAAGTGLSWTSPALPLLKNENSTILPTTKDQGTWIASFLPIGALCGALPAGILAEKVGRKYAAMAIAIPYIIGWALTITAKYVPSLYVARFLIGKQMCDGFLLADIFLTDFFFFLIRYFNWWLMCSCSNVYFRIC